MVLSRLINVVINSCNKNFLASHQYLNVTSCNCLLSQIKEFDEDNLSACLKFNKEFCVLRLVTMCFVAFLGKNTSKLIFIILKPFQSQCGLCVISSVWILGQHMLCSVTYQNLMKSCKPTCMYFFGKNLFSKV